MKCYSCGGYHGSEGKAIDCLIRALAEARSRVAALEQSERDLAAIRAIGRGFRRLTSPEAA